MYRKVSKWSAPATGRDYGKRQKPPGVRPELNTNEVEQEEENEELYFAVFGDVRAAPTGEMLQNTFLEIRQEYFTEHNDSPSCNLLVGTKTVHESQQFVPVKH